MRRIRPREKDKTPTARSNGGGFPKEGESAGRGLCFFYVSTRSLIKGQLPPDHLASRRWYYAHLLRKRNANPDRY